MSSDPVAVRAKLLLIEDDPSFAERMARNLRASDFDVETAGSAEEARPRIVDEDFDLILMDIRLPGKNGLDLLAELNELEKEEGIETPPVVMLTSITAVDTAVEAMRRGASDYLTKEATRNEIVVRLRNILQNAELATENRHLRKTLHRYDEFDEIIGVSEWSTHIKEEIKAIAPSEVTVLITGPTGVGKELVARAIHRTSQRRRGPFVEVNCAALPDENLFLSELFGHERGAYTGALTRKRGLFEQAHGGTLFLDEVAELGPMAQARLLRATETLQFQRLGGERKIQVNCRLLFATNKDLAAKVRERRFREDLFYRINIYPIAVPPLRARPEDIAPLTRFFAARFAEKHHLTPPEFGEGAFEALRVNPWPGNVRELRNVIERLAIRFSGRTVDAAALRDLNLDGSPGATGAIVLPEKGVALEEVEKTLVQQALQRTQWNQRRAAALLGISVDRMNARVKKFKITHPSWRVHN